MRECEREQEQKREEERKKKGLPPAALLPYVAMRDGS
jgi:hypothetical protein